MRPALLPIIPLIEDLCIRLLASVPSVVVVVVVVAAFADTVGTVSCFAALAVADWVLDK